MLDVLVVGAGPAGRAVAVACAERGLRTSVLDPAPGRPWRATYGAWADELPAELPAELVAATAAGRAVAGTEHALDRTYAVLDVAALRAHLDARLAAAGVRIERGRARPGAHPGALPAAQVIIDAGGGAQPLSRRAAPRGQGRQGRESRVAAEQTAVGVVLPAELARPLLGDGEALFMDWRQVPGQDGGWPTFLYGVPLGGGLVLLEETSLARRPGLGADTLTRRLLARLARHGVRPPPGAEREWVRFPLDTPRHRAAGVLGFGAAAPLTHPATGYQLATALRLAPVVADALVRRWDDGAAAALSAARTAVWPQSAIITHHVRRRGLETLLRMPPRLLPEFFEGFFELPPDRRRAYLGGRTDPLGTVAAMAGLFRTTRWPVRVRLIGSSLLVSAPPEYSKRAVCSSVPASLVTKGRSVMGAYQKVLVGTDGSDTSLLAVERAGAMAGDASAELIIVCAYEPANADDVRAASDALGSDAYQVVGSAPAESVLRDAADRARKAGAVKVDTLAVQGPPVDVLDQAVADSRADLLVVGNVGLNTLTGRILGSVPQSVARRSGVDVLIVHTA